MNQRGHGGVGLPGQLLHAVEVVIVGVPAVAGDLDERDAALDEPAGQEATLTEWTRPVLRLRRILLLREIEGLQLRAEDQLGCGLIERLLIDDTGFAAR